MNIWNSEISTAPRDGDVHECSTWSCFNAGTGTIAWALWPIYEPDGPDHTNTDAAISGHRLALLDGPQAANRSEDEALRGMASGGVQDECAIHPANHFIVDDCGSGA